jgi:hypothetical protein
MPAPTSIDAATVAQIKHDYIMLNLTPKRLSEKYDVAEKAVVRRIERGGWYKMRLEEAAKLEDELMRRSAETRIRELIKFNEDDLKMAKAIRGRVARRLQDAENNPKNVISSSELRTLAATCDTAQKMGRLALGAATQNTSLADQGEGPIKGGSIAASIVDVPIDEIDEGQRNAIIDKYLGKLAG